MTAERSVGVPSTDTEKPDFSYLSEVQELQTTLAAGVVTEFKVLDYSKLENAEPEVQQKVVLKALADANEVYRGRENSYKLRQMRNTLGAYQDGTLTVHELLLGLELIPEPKSESSGDGGFLGRIRNTVGGMVRKIRP